MCCFFFHIFTFFLQGTLHFSSEASGKKKESAGNEEEREGRNPDRKKTEETSSIPPWYRRTEGDKTLSEEHRTSYSQIAIPKVTQLLVQMVAYVSVCMRSAMHNFMFAGW